MSSEELTFAGRVAIVTGAGRGIGRTYALELARRGAAVVVNDLGGGLDGSGQASWVPANEVVAEIRAFGGTALANADSVATAEGGRNIVAAALDRFGRVDVVINNAGIIDQRSLADSSVEVFSRVLSVHFFGTLNVTLAAWPAMVAASYGRIVNTFSAAAPFGSIGGGPYGAAKGAIFGFTRSVAVEGQDHGITVNCVAPAAWTRMASGTVVDSDLEAAMMKAMPPERNAPLALFLAHEACILNGEVLSCRGVRYARLFMAETQGVDCTHAQGPEFVADHLAGINDEGNYMTPRDLAEYMIMMSASVD